MLQKIRNSQQRLSSKGGTVTFEEDPFADLDIEDPAVCDVEGDLVADLDIEEKARDTEMQDLKRAGSTNFWFEDGVDDVPNCFNVDDEVSGKVF